MEGPFGSGKQEDSDANRHSNPGAGQFPAALRTAPGLAAPAQSCSTVLISRGETDIVLCAVLPLALLLYFLFNFFTYCVTRERAFHFVFISGMLFSFLYSSVLKASLALPVPSAALLQLPFATISCGQGNVT
mgnify:CR=1 FL=1